ncbi:MAG TPA: STAS domain-containing protein [Planctomycetaceae bacterium]
MATKRKRMNVYEEGGVTVMDLGTMDIWDGADLALIRDTLTALIVREKHDRIGVDMSHVKYIPSGFFGMLFDWKERGVEVYLFDPQPNVRNMLWFRQFAERVAGDAYRLTEVAQEDLRPEGVGHWEDELDSEDVASHPAYPR